MEKIWRVEDDKGYGPYRSEKYRDLCDSLPDILDEYGNEVRPTPFKDVYIKRDLKRSEICGFENFQQLLNWFPEDSLQILQENGFQVKLVEVKKITARGKYQVLAKR